MTNTHLKTYMQSDFLHLEIVLFYTYFPIKTLKLSVYISVENITMCEDLLFVNGQKHKIVQVLS